MKILDKAGVQAMLFMALLVVPGMSLFAQESNKNIDGEQQAGDAIVSPILTAPCMGSRNEPSLDLNWQPLVTGEQNEPENPSPNEERIDSIKAVMQKLKDKAEAERNAEVERSGEADSALSASSVTPVMGSNFAGNPYYGPSPLDNCLAISDGGIIVSTINTTLQVYNTSGTRLFTNTIRALINDPTIVNICDEYVVYDEKADRFIAFAEECSAASANSYLLILFSKTNNPATGGWWYDKISGNPFGNSEWFDYPKVALSDSEVYISGNLYNNAKNFQEAALWQIRKSDGYSGNALTYRVWHGFNTNPFTVAPVGEGHGQSYGPGCYLVATYNDGGDSIHLYHITNYLADSPTMVYKGVKTTAYTLGANAPQLGTSVTLNTQDTRVMNGFYLNGYIHFVFMCNLGTGGYCAINYNRLNVSTLTNTSKVFGLTGYDYGFPAVASFTTSPTDMSVMIGFGRSGSTIYPEERVVACDNNMNFSTDLLVKSSQTYVYYTNNPERWGDYTGITRRNNLGAPSVWVAGSYGVSSPANVWSTWLAEIHEVTVGINEVGDAPLVNAKVYPNPVSDVFQLEFNLSQLSDVEVDIYDMEGQLVKDLYKGKAYVGDNLLSFNKSNLSPGVYFLTIRNDSGILRNEKIVITE